MAEVLGLHPWHLGDLTTTELVAAIKYLKPAEPERED